MSRGTVIRIVVTLLILAWLCYRINWTELGATVQSLRVEVWLLALAGGLCVQVVIGTRWWLLARALGFDDGWFRFVQLYLVGLYFNLFMPSVLGGDVVRALYLDSNRGKRPLAMVSVFVEQSTNMLSMMAFGLAAAMVSWKSLEPWMPVLVLVVCGGALLFSVVVVLSASWMSRKFAAAQSRVGRFVHSYVQSFADAVAVYRQRKSVFVASLGLVSVAHTLNFTVTWLIARSLRIEVEWSYFVIIVPLVATLLIVPISISGIGVRETGFGFFLSLRGVSDSGSVSLGLLCFFNLALISSIGGIFYTVGRFPKLEFKKSSSAPPEAESVTQA